MKFKKGDRVRIKAGPNVSNHIWMIEVVGKKSCDLVEDPLTRDIIYYGVNEIKSNLIHVNDYLIKELLGIKDEI